MRTALPPLFLARMADLLGDEYGAFRASLDAAPVAGLRVNTLKIRPEAFRALAPFELAPLPWPEDGFRVAEEALPGARPGRHPYHAAGLYYLQEPSAMLPALLLAPQPGERVLDLSAAPGGKATQIAGLMNNTGLLIANEVNPRRAWELAGNLERWGARAAAITNETPERLADHCAGFFDRVLVDAPCSGEGMFRKSEAARQEWRPALVSGCALRQAHILAQASRLVRPGGLLAYSTCTFNLEENEGVIGRFLGEHPEFDPVDPPRLPGHVPDQAPGGAPDRAPGRAPGASQAVRLWPHRHPGEGCFAAVLHRRDEKPAPSAPNTWRPPRLPKPAEEAYRAFCSESLNRAPALERLALVGSYLYALPDGLPELSGLRFLHPGWWLGALKGDRFEPSHALALGLRRQDARQVLDLPAAAPELRAYLQGQSLPAAGEPGWVLVAVDGFPLGWARRTHGVAKNYYPKGLRWV